ncbi:hypothetical protein PPROV_000633000 [Pycnococcus provasolii]|uniref:Pectinesterase inhibitor domain-containing protein n=1 Tax=Pycnococcus provasolii TaxID=41880 RepID=A0A830HL40_9CHLO|nr:hypothetical protein PPROV_000633000 [Pycnococcus provasolii]
MTVMLRMTVASVCALTSILSVSLGGVAGHTSAAIGMRRTLLDDDGLVLDSDVGKLSLDFIPEAVSNIKMCFEEKVKTIKESVEIELEEETEACEIQLQEQLEELNDEEEDDEEAEEAEEAEEEEEEEEEEEQEDDDDDDDEDDDDEVRSSKRFKKLKKHISKYRGRGKHGKRGKHGRRGLLMFSKVWRGRGRGPKPRGRGFKDEDNEEDVVEVQRKSAKKPKKSAKKPKKSKQSFKKVKKGAYAARKQLEKIRQKARGVANAYGLMKTCIKFAQQAAFAKTREEFEMLKQDTECLKNERETAKDCAMGIICADQNVKMAEQSFNKAQEMIATMSGAINDCSSKDITAVYECVKGMIGDLKPSAIQESLKAVKEVSICPTQNFQTLEFEPVEVVDGEPTEAANPPEPPLSETTEAANPPEPPLSETD